MPPPHTWRAAVSRSARVQHGLPPAGGRFGVAAGDRLDDCLVLVPDLHGRLRVTHHV